MRNICLSLNVYILGAVEARRSAGAYAVGTQRLYSLFFQRLIPNEVVEVIGGEVRDGTAIA